MGSINRRIDALGDDAGMIPIPQADGSVFYHKQGTEYKAFGLYWLTCAPLDAYEEERFPIPALLLAIANAKDKEGAMDRVWPRWRTSPPKCALDLSVLIEEGRIVEDKWAAAVMAADTGDEYED
jgi:hypothetical protein